MRAERRTPVVFEVVDDLVGIGVAPDPVNQEAKDALAEAPAAHRGDDVDPDVGRVLGADLVVGVTDEGGAIVKTCGSACQATC